MSRLANRAEVIKLSRALSVDVETLSYLHGLPSDAVAQLRSAISDVLHDEQREPLGLLAAVARWLPAWVSALCARSWFGAPMTARLACELPAWRVADIANYLDAEFLADIAVDLDPRSAREVVDLLAAKKVIAITHVLLGRDDFVTLGRFVALLPDAVLIQVAESIEDEGDLLQVLFFIEARYRIDHIVRLIPIERMQRAVLLVCDEARRELWPSLLALLTHAGYGLKRELGDLAAAQGEGVLTAIIETVQAEDLWEDVLPVVVCLSPEVQKLVVNLPVLQRPEVLERIIQATSYRQLWSAMLCLVEAMNANGRDALARIFEQVDDAHLAQAAYAALLRSQWHTLLDIVRRLTPARQRDCHEILVHYMPSLDSETADYLQRLLREYGVDQAAQH
ncbi:MAG: hypothetical protein ABIR53_02780 [Paraperlucidibaca sp.]